MRNGNFSGITILDQGEGITDAGAAFGSQDRSIIDRLLGVGAVTHRHDAHAPLADPTAAPSAAITTSGGAIPGDRTIYVGFTLLDSTGGETLLSEVEVETTAAQYDAPTTAPDASADYTGGSLLIGTYHYAITFTDGLGGETPVGPPVVVTRDPGYASGQVLLSGMADAVTEAGVSGWRLYRAQSGQYDFLAEGSANTFTDTGAIPLNCAVQPPAAFQNTTGGANLLTVVVPSGSAGVSSAASQFNLYLSEDGLFEDPSLYGTYPPSSAGVPVQVPSLALLSGAPPLVSQALRGANQIDPDTELIDWHWKRPVATAADLPTDAQEGDVRFTLDDGLPHRFIGSAWGLWPGTGGGANPEGSYGTDLTIDPAFPLAIPDNGTPLVVPFTIPDTMAGVVSRLSVGLYLTHPHASDLTITIESPDGFSFEIVSHEGGVDFGRDPGGFGDTLVLNDDAPTRLEATGNNVGPHRPSNPLAQMRGESMPGLWTLTITDTVSGNAGHLYNATLIFENAPLYPMDMAVGWMDPLTNLPAAGIVGRQSGARTEIYLRALNADGDYREKLIWNDLGEQSGAVGNYASGWAAALPYNGEPSGAYIVEPDGRVSLSGQVAKASGVAPVANETMFKLPVIAIPAVNKLFPAATGDGDGPVPGMVKIMGQVTSASGQVWLVAGTSGDPATKLPYVSLDGIDFTVT